MSKVEYKYIPLNDLFTPKNGKSKYTKAYCYNNKGAYPVYSANTEEEFSFINSWDYEGQYITWTKDGLAGYLMVNEGKFSITGHRGILIPNNTLNNIDLNYIKFILEPLLRNAKKGRYGDNGKNEYTTINPDMIKKLNIQIPFPLKNGSLDIDKQKELSCIYYDINLKKQKLLERINEIKRLIINIDLRSRIKYVCLNNMFNFKNGDSKYTKYYCQKNKGDYPVYSASTEKEFAYINSFDYSGNYITWVKDGLAGYLMVNSGDFSITGHRGIFILKDEFKNINLNYIKYILQPFFRSAKKGRIGEFGKNEYSTLNPQMIKKLNIQIPIPIKENGDFDLEKQQEIANKYKQIEEIKKGLIEKIQNILEIKVKPSES